MAAFPFGGHPQFADYCDWALQQGCKVQSGYTVTPDGKTMSVTRITAPSGKWVYEVGTQQGEFLVPTTIARLDRRLGLKSPFFSIDPVAGYGAPEKQDAPEKK